MSETLKNIARWIVLLPAALAGAVAARAVIVLVNRFTMSSDWSFTNADGFLGRVWLTWVGGAFMGAAGVWIAYYVAPCHRRISASAMGAIWLMLAGAALFLSIVTSNGWAIWDSIALVVGAVAMVVTVWTDDTFVNKDPSMY